MLPSEVDVTRAVPSAEQAAKGRTDSQGPTCPHCTGTTGAATSATRYIPSDSKMKSLPRALVS